MTIDYKLKSLSVYNLVVFMGSMWFMPFMSTLNISKNSLTGGSNVYKLCDKGWSETLGGQGMFNSFMKFSLSLQVLQDNGIKVFMKMFLVFSVVLILYII